MKKRILALLICGIISASLSACGGKPENMNEQTYNLGTSALEVMESYINAEISSDEASEKLDNISDRFDDIGNSLGNAEDTTDNLLASSDNTIISSYVTNFKLSMLMDDNDGMIDACEDLKEALKN